MTLPFRVKAKAEKSGLPAIAAISGVNIFPTKEVMTRAECRADHHRHGKVHHVPA